MDLQPQLAIFYGPLCIGRYEANGMLKGNGVKAGEAIVKKAEEHQQKAPEQNDNWVMEYYKANYFGNNTAHAAL